MFNWGMNIVDFTPGVEMASGRLYRVEVGVSKPTQTEFVELNPAQPLHQIELQRQTPTR